MRTKENYFLSQPHQPFFLLGIVNAVIMMLLFGLNYKGILPLDIDPLTLHSYSLIYLVFTNFFTGFLFTTFPRFNQTDTIDKGYYTKIFYANTAASVLFILGANHIGLFAHLLFIISIFIPAILNTAINSAFYLYLIFLAFSVGQRMIPFFSHSFAQKGEHFVRNVFILFVLKFIFSISEFKALELIVDIALALYLGHEFYHWELHPFHSPAILWVLHLALFWLPISFALSALSLTAELFLDTSFYFFNVHLLAIGFLTTVLIGFGTRVTLGHAGMPPHADKFVTALFFFIQLVVLLRALYSFNIAFRWDMNSLFDISFTAWLLLFVLWGSRYSKILIFRKKV